MSVSNLELLYSYIRMRQLRRQAGDTMRNLLHLKNEQVDQGCGNIGDPATAATTATGNGTGKDALAPRQANDTRDTTLPSPHGRQHDTKDVGYNIHSDAATTRDELLHKLQTLRDAAEHIESVALLYPALHTPTFQGALDQHCDGSDQGLIPAVTESPPSTVQLLQDDEQQLAEVIRQRQWASTKFALKWKVGCTVLFRTLTTGSVPADVFG